MKFDEYMLLFCIFIKDAQYVKCDFLLSQSLFYPHKKILSTFVNPCN